MAVKSNIWNNDCQLAREISIDDIGDYYTGTDVEEALQEIGVKDSSDDSRFDDIEADVAQNTSDISTNAGNISTNTGNISTNASDISDLQADKLDITAPTVDAEVKTIKINDTTDDASTLGAGTIKYNTTDERFEGSDGSDWIPIGSGTGSFIDPGYNYANPDMEINIDGYNKYANTTAGDEPETGSGGTPVTITRAIESTTPLIGTQSLKISKSAANGQGEGVGYGAATGLFSLDYGFEYRESQIKFNYVTTANYVDGDMGLFIYDIDNTTLIKASVVDIPSSSGEPTEFFATWLPTGGTNYRLIWHVRTTSALAYDMTIDNIRIGAKQDIVGDVGRWEELTDFVSSGSQTVTYAVEDGRYVAIVSDTLATGLKLYRAIIDVDSGYTECGGVWYNGSTTFNITYNPSTGVWDSGQSNWVIIKIEKWIEAKNIKLATELTEYASNYSTTDADDTTSFAYGASGSEGIIGNTNISANVFKRVQFKNPIQPTDTLDVEILNPATGQWTTGLVNVSTSARILANQYGYRDAGGGTGLLPISAYEVDVVFYRTPFGYLNTLWNDAEFSGIRWRVRKTSGGNPAEIPPLVRAEYTNQTETAINTALKYTVLLEDTHGAYDPTTGLFTAPYDGVYAGFFSVVPATSTIQDMYQLHSGATGTSPIAATGSTARHRMPFSLRMNKGETVYFYASASTIQTNSADRLVIERIGS